MRERKVILKKGREKPIVKRHHWIFSGAVQSFPKYEDGEILPVYSHDKAFLGQAYFNSKTSISGRILTFSDQPVKPAIDAAIASAVSLRKLYFNSSVTNCYRLVNAEGDFLPGLIADYYNGVVVIQISTLGMDKLKQDVLKAISQSVRPSMVYEKSALASRSEEGLEDQVGVLSGEFREPIEVFENGIKFHVYLKDSQKTGFYLDQREMRALAGSISKGRRVLNCFSYTGGFTVYALAGGAKACVSVDNSRSALQAAKENIMLNNLQGIEHDLIGEDVFKFLRMDSGYYDFIVLDPPAFCKKKNDVNSACRGYKDINRLAFKKIGPEGGYVMTCSCSHFISQELFQKVVFDAAVEAGRRVRILRRHVSGFDHPVNVCHPETDYLKGFLLFVE